MISLLRLALEKAINQAINSEPTNQAHLKALNAKTVALECMYGTDKSLTLWLLFHPTHINVLHCEPETCHTRIKTSVQALLNYFSQQENSTADQQFEIQGQLGVAQKMLEWASQLNVNWIDLLSPMIGETPAYYVSQTGEKLYQWQKAVRPSLKEDLQEYVFDEFQLLMSQQQKEAVLQRIKVLETRLSS